MAFKILLLLILPFQAYAIGDEKLWPKEGPKNFCLDPEAAKNNEDLARKHPTDERMIKLVALRAGLCQLIEKNIIGLDFAIDLFEYERNNHVLKRLQEQVTESRKLKI